MNINGMKIIVSDWMPNNAIMLATLPPMERGETLEQYKERLRRDADKYAKLIVLSDEETTDDER